MSKAKGIKRSMKKCIDEIASLSAQYTQNPDVDFTRNRKLSFSEVMKAILILDGFKGVHQCARLLLISPISLQVNVCFSRRASVTANRKSRFSIRILLAL